MQPEGNPFGQYGSFNYIDPFFQNLEPDTASNYLKATSSDARFPFKTKICPFLLSGKCFKGDSCTFAHNEDELKKIPNLTKTKLCLCFQMGYCQNGKECSFAHGESELRAPPNFYKTSLCVPFMSGMKCRFGIKCRFAHGYNELRQRPHCEPETTISNMHTLKSESNFIPIYNPPPQMQQMPKLMQFESLEEKIKKENTLKLSSNFKDTFSSSTIGTPLITDKQNFFRMKNTGSNLFDTNFQGAYEDASKYSSQSQLQMMGKKASMTKMSEQKLPTPSYY